MRILKRPAVQAKAGLSKTHLYLQISEGTFPKPVRLGRKSLAGSRPRSTPGSKLASVRGTVRDDGVF